MEILNRAHLAEITGGDIDIDAELYSEYILYTPEYIAAIKTEVDTAKWLKAIHALKGTSANIGADRIADLCLQAQEAGVVDAAIIAEIETCYAQTIQEMKHVISQVSWRV